LQKRAKRLVDSLLGEIKHMGRAGKALKSVLDAHSISQNQLAMTMGIDRSNVSRWVSGSRDPSAEAVAEIKQALVTLKAPAAEEFVQLYLYSSNGLNGLGGLRPAEEQVS
jgi:transcriptional regulator with XRE-family HTH domain